MGFENYFQINEILLRENSLVFMCEKFDARPFKEFLAGSQYFIDSITDIKCHIDEYSRLYSLLKSKRSKDVLVQLLRAKLTLNYEYLKKACDRDISQYFLDRFFTFSSGEIFVDCGSCEVETAIEFIKK